MTTTVMTLIPKEATKPSLSAGYFAETAPKSARVRQVDRVRPSARDFVVKSSMPIRGSAKKVRTSVTVTHRKIDCLRRKAAR